MTLFLPFIDYICNEDLIWTKTIRNCCNGSQNPNFSLHMMQDAQSRFPHSEWWLLALSIFIICLPVIGYLSCFHSPDIVNRAAMYTVFLVWYRVLWVAAQERHSWILWKTCLWFSKELQHLAHLTTARGHYHFPHLCQHLFSSFLNTHLLFLKKDEISK